jgi:hypothetical protein
MGGDWKYKLHRLKSAAKITFVIQETVIQDSRHHSKKQSLCDHPNHVHAC